MTKQITFSRLAIAAAALIAASATSFAQTESVKSQTESGKVVVSRTVAVNNERKSNESFSTN